MNLKNAGLCFFMLSATVSAEFEIELGGAIEGTYFHPDLPAPGLEKFDSENFFNPRLELSIDALFSDYLYFHATGRYDRGFNAGDRKEGEARLDEVFLRYRPFGDQTLSIQIGKSATVFGSYVNDHQFHDDAFLIAPLPYSQLVGVGVQSVNAVSPQAIIGRANGSIPSIYETPKRLWSSTIWGPAYSSGITVRGTQGSFDYGLELKNVSLGAHADQWNPDSEEFEHPTVSMRLAYRPSHAWQLGISYSEGPYLNQSAIGSLPSGLNRGDLTQRLVGVDARWSRGDLIFNAELIASQFETLRVGNLENISGYLQTRWKVQPGFWLAARVGHTLNSTARLPDGSSIDWAPNLWRFELGAGYRVTPDFLIKAQYAFTNTEGDSPAQGRNLLALGASLRF